MIVDNLAMGVVSLDQQPPLEVEISPLESEEFAKAETSSHGAEEQRVVPWRMALNSGQEDGDFFGGERIHLPTV